MKTLILLVMFAAPPRVEVPVPGVLMTLSTGQVSVTDAKGEYALQVPNCWTGRITPSKAGYRFEPAYLDVRCLQTGIKRNFAAKALRGKGNSVTVVN